MDRKDMPMGFSMALAMNPDAMKEFALLSEEKKQRIIAGTHTLCSKAEMQQYVNNLVSGKKNDTKI